jgi:SIR2-like domain
MLVSSWVEHGTGDRPRLRSKLRAYLANERKPLPTNPLHDLLALVAQQRPMAIITTNYDDLIELALIKQNVPFDLFVIAIDRPSTEERAQGITLFRRDGQDELKPVIADRELLDFEVDAGEVRLKRTVLFKIHGHIGRMRRTDDTFVITEEDYVSFLGRMSLESSVIPADLVNLMQSRTLLFLGYSLHDWNFRVLLDRVNRLRNLAIRSYAIASDIDPAESRLWDKRNVAVFRTDLNLFVPRLHDELVPPPGSST